MDHIDINTKYFSLNWEYVQLCVIYDYMCIKSQQNCLKHNFTNRGKGLAHSKLLSDLNLKCVVLVAVSLFAAVVTAHKLGTRVWGHEPEDTSLRT